MPPSFLMANVSTEKRTVTRTKTVTRTSYMTWTKPSTFRNFSTKKHRETERKGNDKMSSFKRVATLVLVLFDLYDKVAGDRPNLQVVYSSCNNQGFGGSNSQPYYHNAMEKVFHDLITQTPFSGFDRYCNFLVEDENTRILDTFYGHGSCNGELAIFECANCLIAAAGLIRQDCPLRFGATFQLRDCRIRYELYSFTDP